jgi:hypothetical protein
MAPLGSVFGLCPFELEIAGLATSMPVQNRRGPSEAVKSAAFNALP